MRGRVRYDAKNGQGSGVERGGRTGNDGGMTRKEGGGSPLL